MALIRNARLAESFSREQIHLDDAGVKLRNLRDVHAERPHRLQWRVDDHCLRGAKWWSHPNRTAFQALLEQGWALGDRHNHAPRFHRMLDQLMGACYLIQR